MIREECEIYKISNAGLSDYTETCLSFPTEFSSLIRPGLQLRDLESKKENTPGFASEFELSSKSANASAHTLTTTTWHNPWPTENTGRLVNARLASKTMSNLESYEDLPNNQPFVNNPFLREFALKLDSQAKNHLHAGAYR